MKYSSFVKMGNKVFSNNFREPVIIVDILDICNEKKPTKKEIDEFPNLINVYIMDDDGNHFCVGADDLQPVRHLCDLSYDELKELRSQICVGSIFYVDYENTLGVPAKEVCDWSDSYCEDIDGDFDNDSAEKFADYIMSNCA